MSDPITREEMLSIAALIHRHNQLFMRVVMEEVRRDYDLADYFKQQMAEVDKELAERWGLPPCHGLALA